MTVKKKSVLLEYESDRVHNPAVSAHLMQSEAVLPRGLPRTSTTCSHCFLIALPFHPCLYSLCSDLGVIYCPGKHFVFSCLRVFSLIHSLFLKQSPQVSIWLTCLHPLNLYSSFAFTMMSIVHSPQCHIPLFFFQSIYHLRTYNIF